MRLDKTMPFVVAKVEHFIACEIAQVTGARKSLNGLWAIGHWQLIGEEKFNKLKLYPESVIYGYSSITELMKTEEWFIEDQDLIPFESHIYGKIYDLSIACETTIVSGFNSTCLGEEKMFDSKMTDQANIGALCTMAMAVMSGLTTKELSWKGSGEMTCYIFSPQQVIALGMDMHTHIETNIKRFEELRLQVLACKTIEEVNAITW